ncbi:MAG: rRNA pseudouridine synthase [Clostridiales Family XIII bacterium]|jgi:23S rRNA pseudouridine2605 synthase|nr:rRNA pseudouridine synthase [Clostridiales Family XIII bacterium]
MRLNKYIANAGLASRRGADALIADGKVRVGGKVVRELGYDYDEAADGPVSVNGKTIAPAAADPSSGRTAAKKIYIALHKPKGYITTTKDERGRPTVMDLVADADARLFPIGRLDGPTTGLLLLTNDGDFAQRLAHPKHETVKTYRARVTGPLTKGKIERLRRGVDIGGYVTKPAEVEVVKQAERSMVIEIKIHEGKNRQVRKMFAAVGCKVVDLERTAVGAVRLGRLLPGHWRKLTLREIESLL